MREPGTRRTPSRVTGRAVLVRSMRLLLVRVHRFGQHRAATAADLTWCARTIDALAAVLQAHDAPPEARP